MNDSTSFGGFISSFLTAVRDQHTKLPCFVVPFLSTGLSKQLRSGDVSRCLAYVCSTLKLFQSAEMRNVINDALYLCSLNDNASLSVPVQPTLIWPTSLWNEWRGTKVGRSKIAASCRLIVGMSSLRISIVTPQLFLPCSKVLQSLCGKVEYCLLVGWVLTRLSEGYRKVKLISHRCQAG